MNEELNYESVISNYFSKHIDVSEVILEFLLNRFVPFRYEAKELIVEAGTVAKYFYLVVDGVQAIYHITEKGERAMAGFSYKGEQSGVFDSFITKKPSMLFLESVSHSHLIGISRNDFEELFSRFPIFFKWEAKFLEAILFGRLTRETEMLTLSARERFREFMKRCPQELHQIPQKYIASYLNMKPETFSRLRAERE